MCLKLINNIRYFYYFYCILAAVSEIWGKYVNFKTPKCLDKIFNLNYVLTLIFINLNNSFNEKLYFTDSAHMEMGILAYIAEIIYISDSWDSVEVYSKQNICSRNVGKFHIWYLSCCRYIYLLKLRISVDVIDRKTLRLGIFQGLRSTLESCHIAKFIVSSYFIVVSNTIETMMVVQQTRRKTRNNSVHIATYVQPKLSNTWSISLLRPKSDSLRNIKLRPMSLWDNYIIS